MKAFNLRTTGVLDFQVKARSMAEAQAKLERLFAIDNVVDPLTNRTINDRITCLGYYVLECREMPL